MLDLLVEAVEDGEDGAFEGLFGLDVGVDEALGVDADVLEEAGDAAEGLVEVVTLLEGLRDGLAGLLGEVVVSGERGMAYLESALVLLCVLAVDLLNGSHVLLEVATSVLPCLQTLSEQAGASRGVEVGHSVVVAQGAHVGGSPRGELCGLGRSGRSHSCDCVVSRRVE